MPLDGFPSDGGRSNPGRTNVFGAEEDEEETGEEEEERVEGSLDAVSWRFHLFRLFWNQILTWVSVNRRETASPDRSELDR